MVGTIQARDLIPRISRGKVAFRSDLVGRARRREYANPRSTEAPRIRTVRLRSQGEEVYLRLAQSTRRTGPGLTISRRNAEAINVYGSSPRRIMAFSLPSLPRAVSES